LRGAFFATKQSPHANPDCFVPRNDKPRARLCASPNTAELASLWHLPYGEGAPLVERTLSKRILPMREHVANGVHIGHAVHHGERIPVHLAPDAFQLTQHHATLFLQITLSQMA